MAPYLELAESDPIAAVRSALALEHFWERWMVILELGDLAARSNPEVGLALAASLEDFALAIGYRSALLEAWAEIDPEAAFDHLDTASAHEIPTDARAFAGFAASDPERAGSRAWRAGPSTRPHSRTSSGARASPGRPGAQLTAASASLRDQSASRDRAFLRCVFSTFASAAMRDAAVSEYARRLGAFDPEHGKPADPGLHRRSGAAP